MDLNNILHCNLAQLWNLDEVTSFSYIRDITKVLAEFSWIYSTKNTEIFICNVLENIPSDWVEAILALPLNEFKQIPLGFTKDNWPSSLKKFIIQCTQLAELRFPKSNLQCEIREEITSSQFSEKNVPLKKQNEIVAMSSLIYQICRDVKCCKVLDIGSGLGYLDQLLHHKFGLQCIGLDSAKVRTERAKCRLKEDPCFHSMHHETMLVANNDDCAERVRIILKNAHNAKPSCDCKTLHFPEDSTSEREALSFVMVGLHSCGNLTQDMMKLFCSMKEFKAFVCIGCCYNKINLDEFPMSEAAQNAVHSVCEHNPEWQPCISGLRLGSHATRSELKFLMPEVLQSRERGLIYKGILQYYISKEKINWHKPKRRIKAKDLTDFETYCDIMFQNQQTSSDTERSERFKKLSDIYCSKEPLFPRVKVLLILQMMLQPLWECFVILDRMMYFKEKSILAEVFAVWDDSISPRNMALCAYKA